MALSDDLTEFEAYLALCAAGGALDIGNAELGWIQRMLRTFAKRADVIERALEVTAEQLSPARDRAALEAGLASGKVALLAAHRVQRLPDLDQPGWIA